MMVQITYSDVGEHRTDLSSFPPPPEGFRMKITPVQDVGDAINLEDHIKFILHDKILTPCFSDLERESVIFHGDFITVQTWCQRLHASSFWLPHDKYDVSVWWWNIIKDLVKSIARDVASSLKALRQNDHYHGNLLNGTFIGPEPSNIFNKRLNVTTGYVGNFRRHKENTVEENQDEDIHAFYQLLVYVILYADRQSQEAYHPDIMMIKIRNLSIFPSDLKKLLDCLTNQTYLASLSHFPMGWIFGHPYLCDEEESIHFIDVLHHLLYEEGHPSLLWNDCICWQVCRDGN